MATSNVKKKIAALSELRKDPAAAIERAWQAVRGDAIETGKQPAGGEAHDSDLDLIEQVVGAVVADTRADIVAAAKKASGA